MKRILTLLAITALPAWIVAQVPDSTGLPGDHFSLAGALEMFKKASTPEEFEKLLNEEDNAVNNLDINEDGQVDYLRVSDEQNGNRHYFHIALSHESGRSIPVAVIELEKTGEEEAWLQIVGSKELYGEEKVVQPVDEKEEAGDYFESDFSRSGPYAEVQYAPRARVIVNVWFWPCVRFVFGPSYHVWVSPWGWNRYPAWYRPWRPVPFHHFYPRTVVYYRYYRPVHRPHVIHHPGGRPPHNVIHQGGRPPRREVHHGGRPPRREAQGGGGTRPRRR